MLARSIGDNRAINRLTIEHDALHTLLLTIWMDSDLVVGLAELTVHGVVGSCLRQTRINADAIVVGFDTQNKL